MVLKRTVLVMGLVRALQVAKHVSPLAASSNVARRSASTFGDVLIMPKGPDVLKRALSADGFVSAKAVDISAAVAEICAVQHCSPLAATALGRALVATVLIADGIDKDEVFQVHFAGDGPLRGVTAICNGALEMRGYVGNPAVGGDRNVKRGVGNGSLQVVRLKNLPGELYARPVSSIVDIVSGEIAEDINHYVATSEQREGALSAGVFIDEQDVILHAGGWRLELLPGAPQEVADQLVANVKRLLDSCVQMTEMLANGQSCDDMLGMLLKDMDYNILDGTDVASTPAFKCSCGIERVYRTLALLPRHEVRAISAANENVEIKCEFCSRQYSLTAKQVDDYIDDLDKEKA
ncbi:heat shock protein Hsp33 [Pelagophyceae sp. CCMP2097]|nr:heat shock protein Hsp33 [Pelagophyceae sp. CCMP2097]